MNNDSTKNQVFSTPKESFADRKDSFDNFSEETISKWRIGRKNFP